MTTLEEKWTRAALVIAVTSIACALITAVAAAQSVSPPTWAPANTVDAALLGLVVGYALSAAALLAQSGAPRWMLAALPMLLVVVPWTDFSDPLLYVMPLAALLLFGSLSLYRAERQWRLGAAAGLRVVSREAG